MDEDERQRKLEAGRAKNPSDMPRSQALASFRQKRAKSDSAGAPKKTQKRKGQNVSKNDSSTQNRHVEAVCQTASATELNKETADEEPQKPEESEVQRKEQRDQPPTPEQCPSPVEDLGEEELAALTSKEQLKLLQQAVEKRNEIIAKLSSNLQDALASRDQVQLEAQSLAGQIQALQKQLQQTSVEFLRLKDLPGAEFLNNRQHHHGQPFKDPNINHKEVLSEESGNASPGSQPGLEGFSTDSDTEPDAVLHKLQTELEQERKKSQRICAELAEEMEKNQHVLSLLEKERQRNKEEQEERVAQLQNLQTQLKQLQTQCLEMQQYKEEKENLNREVLELRKRLQEEEDAERRFNEDVASSALHLQSFEEERRRQQEEMKQLKEEHREEVERVRQLLDERERELKKREEEVKGLKASKNRQNQAKAGSSSERTSIDEANLESGPDRGSMNTSLAGDILMERYLSSVPLAHSQSSLAHESFEHCSQLDISANHSFELNSEMFEDQPFLSISNRPYEEIDITQNSGGSECCIAGAGDSSPQPFSKWPHNSTTGEMDLSNVSGQQLDETDLEKNLLNQQCGELREELILKERDLIVLREEVIKSAEELEEARDRWAQVTDDLRQALWELEEEKEKRRLIEEEMNLKANEQDKLENHLGALLEKQEAEAETSLLISASVPLEDENKLSDEPLKKKAPQNQQDDQLWCQDEIKPTNDSARENPKLSDDLQMHTLQDQCDHLTSELEETKTQYKTTSTLLSQKTVELDTVLKELETTHVQVLNSQTEVERLQHELLKSRDGLDSAEKVKNELESQISSLSQNLVHLEEAQTQSAQQREEEKRKEQGMEEQIKKMEQVLEEELEQFEKLLKAKDLELAGQKEKWEEERQEKEKLLDVTRGLEEQVKALLEKQVLAVDEATEKLKSSHKLEINDMMEKHGLEVSELSACLESKLLKFQVSLEEEQKRQISLIKQVTEREHDRMMSELTEKHNKELDELSREVPDLRESMEAAHQAELQQAQSQKNLELEALRLSLTTVHTSQLQHSHTNMQQEQESALSKVQASMRETFSQETALMQARHQSELEQTKRQSEEQQERLHELHQQEMDDLKQQREIHVSQDRASEDEKQSNAIQALKAQWEMEAEANFKKSFSEIQNTLTGTQKELSSTQASLTATTKALAEAEAALSQTQSELQETEKRLTELQTSSKEQVQKLEEELKQACANRDSLEKLVSSQKTVLQEKEQQALRLEDKERQLQQEVLQLEKAKELLKQTSKEEVGQLWTQIESMRASRQELGELKEQLLARSSHVDDIERLKKEFNQQKYEIKEQNEAELENLRRYFEKRLHATEESYKEEITLLQLRLVEGALEESLLKTTDESNLFQMQEEVKNDVTCDGDKLEKQKLHLEDKHTKDLSNLQSSLALSFNDELQQVHLDLTDHYYEELQDLKTRHALDLEHLRAKLSESHLKDLTRVHLEAAMQVEAQVEQRIWFLIEEMQTNMTTIHILDNKLASLSKQHNEEIQLNSQKLTLLEEALKKEKENMQENMEKLKELQQKHECETSALTSDLEQTRTRLEKDLHEEKQKFKSLDNNDSPQVLIERQRLEAQYDRELQNVKNCLSAEIKDLQEQSQERICQAQQRFQEEKAVMEQHLVQRYEMALAELKSTHGSELERERSLLLNKNSQEMAALEARHRAQLASLSAAHREQLAAMAVELETKHKAQLVALETARNSTRDLDSLEAVFQETKQAQLEALEAELVRKHQEERDELEVRMLGNMDTLEATYLKEVQALRNDIIQLEEKHREELICRDSANKQLIECHAAEHLSIREELRKELAQVHMEKFKAMAAELSHLHKTELGAQKEALDTEHCKALETLKKQVLELEKQHNAALQDLSQTCSAEKQQLIEHHQLQLQELRGTSARESEACRRELGEESSRQRQHFVEEVELLKVKSEEKLQDRINQLKTEFEEQKEAELEDLRRSFTSEQQEKEQSYTDKMSQLTAQLQQLDAVVTQLRAEIGCLQGELHGKRSEMETLDTLLQRRERESQEGANLLKMLTGDLHTAKEERCRLYNANEKLGKVLVEMLRSIIAIEEMIGQKISTRTQTSDQGTQWTSSTGNKDAQESGISVADLSTDNLELTQLLCESLLVSDTQIHPGGEERALNACCRLRHAVDTLLDLLNQANIQLEQTCNVHFSLEEKFSKGREDSAQLFQQHKVLVEQLDMEAKLKSQLQVELHKAEGLVEGYMVEKAALEESLQQKETREERLVEELEDLKVKLQKMQVLTTELDGLRVKHQDLSEEHAILLRQKEHLSAGLGEREKALLAETQRLTQDRMDLHRQAEKDHKSLSTRLRTLERELEEQETKVLETELHNKTHTEDLDQHVQALEKQLKHNRQFIEEQAVEREHERDEFQQEIRRLEAQLRQTPNVENKGHRFEDLMLQVESLQAIIKDKIEDHDSLCSAHQQAQRDLAERNEEIDKLAGRIRELEQALLNSTQSVRSVGELEQELHRAKRREQELTQDKLALEQQQLSSRLQISALQSKLDETRHCYHDNTRDPTQELRDALDTAQQNLRAKENEAEVLLSQVENVQRDLDLKEVELKHLTLQLELLTNKNTEDVNELQEQISGLKEQISALTIVNEEQEHSHVEEAEQESLSSALLQEKNQEIDHLSCEIQRLEQELENARDNEVGALEEEVEDLRAQVERLQSEVTRVRHDRQEEEERLHEVISTLQAELSTLGPNLHEVSDSQDGDSINPSPAPSPEPRQYTIQEQERRGGPSSLKHELSLTHSAASNSLRSHLKTLQSQLETAVVEKEGLERLLLTQEEEYRRQGEEFGKRLQAEREKSNEVQGLLVVKETELQEVEAKVEEEREKRNLLEEETNSLKAQVEGAAALYAEQAHLHSLVLELEKKEEVRENENKTLKAKEQDMKMEMEVLRETGLTLERQLQEMKMELGDLEEMVSEGRARIKTLETAKGELSAEREVLRRREGQLQEEIKKLRHEVTSMKALIQELTVKLHEKDAKEEEAQSEVLTHADVTLAKADASLRQTESELAGLKAEHQLLRTELAAAKQGLSTSTERAERLYEEGQTKDCALADLENDNQQLKVELQRLQADLDVQEEELAYQQKELELLRQQCHHQDTLSHQEYPQKGISHRSLEDVVASSREEASLSSPEVLRRHECSEDRIRERFHTSVFDSHLCQLSGLNSTGLDPPKIKTTPKIIMESPHSRTITPDPATQSTHSPGSLTVSDNFSLPDSLGADKVHELELLDLTAPSSPLDSTSSISTHEWASDGYGSNVSSELGARLKVELEQTERLDAHFIEYLRCRGMNPTVNTDSAAGSMSYSDDLLSPELQGLLKKVYQESCRILTLSQRRAAPSTSLTRTQHLSGNDLLDHRDELASGDPPMTWQQEKRALQETVIALRELLCRMAQRHTQSDYTDNWHGGQLQTDGRIEIQLRAELEDNQKQLRCAHDTLQEHKNKALSLRLTAEESVESLRREQTRVQELQRDLEQEKALSHRKDREEEERRAAVQGSSEQHKSEIMSLRGQVEQERVAGSNIRQELQIEQSRSVLLEKRLEDTLKVLEDERQQSTNQQQLNLQEKTRLGNLLNEAETRLGEVHTKLADSHKKLDEERERCSRQLDELSRRHEADATRDRKFLSDLRSQLEQERRQGEELALAGDKLRSEFLQSKRKWEDEDRMRRKEIQSEEEATTRYRVTVETLMEQKREVVHDLEIERERFRHQALELSDLKERLRLLMDKERKRDEQWERERKKERQERVEREKRQERLNNKLSELESLRKQDQQRMQELQQTLADLEREEKEMAAQRLSSHTSGQQLKAAPAQHPSSNSHTDATQSGMSQQHQQMPSMTSSNLLETLLKDNSQLTERLTSLNQERTTYRHKLTSLERQLRRSENELAKVTAETENRPINDLASSSRMQRYYERYLRAESFRKALVYQKRYLLLVLGGFQDCEKATLCLIARMGARPSPPLSVQHRPLGRFRAAVRVVIAISRMKFLTRKWQKAVRRLSTSGTVIGHPSGPKVEVLKQQQPRSKSESTLIRNGSAVQRETVSTLIPPTKSPFRLHNRSYSSTTLGSVHSGGVAQDPERSLTEYIHHLEKVQQRLMGARQVSKIHLAPPPKEERRIQSACSPDMIGYRQRWLQDNRTWLYLSCLSPIYLNGPGSPVLQPEPK